MPKDIRYLKGVGEKRAELFAKKGIKTVEDLLYYFPRSHEDPIFRQAFLSASSSCGSSFAMPSCAGLKIMGSSLLCFKFYAPIFPRGGGNCKP